MHSVGVAAGTLFSVGGSAGAVCVHYIRLDQDMRKSAEE